MVSASSLLAIMPFPNIDPVIFSIGPLEVHWYGLAYVAGILLGWLYARRLIATPKLWRNDTPPMTHQQLDDFLLWAAAGVVLGGRIGYILFYDFAAVAAEPLRAFAINKGGMSFHGGLTGTTIAMILFARRHSLPVWSVFDTIATVVPIGLFFGRIANFINAELWGGISNVPWAVVFCNDRIRQANYLLSCPAGETPRHPSQLYEAGLEGIALLIVLGVAVYAFRALKKPGIITGFFVIGYALSRIFVEFFRQPDFQLGYLAFGWLTMGMLLSLPMVALGIWAVIRARLAAGKAG